MNNLKVRKSAIVVLFPVLFVACNQKPLDPATQAKIDKVEAQKKSAADSMATAQDSAKIYTEMGDSLRSAASKMYMDARQADRKAIESKYALNKVFKPEQVAAIKDAVKVRGRSSFIASAYDNIVAGNGSLVDVVKVMSEISNAQKVKQMTEITNGILGFDKDEDGFFAVFVDPKIHALAEKESEELDALSNSGLEAPAMKKIKKEYTGNIARAVKCDSVAQNHKKMADVYAWRQDSLNVVLNEIKKRQK